MSDFDTALGGMSQYLGQNIQKHEARADEMAAKMDIAASGMQGTKEKLDALTPPTAPQIEKPPTLDPKTDPAKAWGSAAMMVAVFGSLLTRTPLTTALSSAAGVLNAYRQGDLQKADREFKTWKANTEYALELNKFQLASYKAAIEKIKAGNMGAMAELKAYAAAYKDENMAMIADTRNLNEVIRHADSMEMAQERLQLSKERLQEMHNDFQTRMEEQRQRTEEQRQWHEEAQAMHREQLEAFKFLDQAHHSGDADKVKEAEQRVQDLNEATGKAHAAGKPTTDINAARQLYSTLYPVNMNGRRVDAAGKAAPDFEHWYSTEWGSLKGKAQAPTSAPVVLPGAPAPGGAPAAPDTSSINSPMPGNEPTATDAQGNKYVVRDGKWVKKE